MNKRKMTSITLAVAVAISTVQLAYPANVFAHEQEVNKTVNEVKIVEKKENNDSGIRENKVIATGYCGADTRYPGKKYEFNYDNKQYENTYYSNIEWKLIENGTVNYKTTKGDLTLKAYSLTLSGSGEMADFGDDWSFNGRPWLISIANDEGFKECNKYNDEKFARFARIAINKVDIEEGISKIGDYAFLANVSLKNANIPRGVETIGNGAFNNCSSLENVTLNSGLKSIEDEVFENSKIGEIVFPDTLEKIGNHVFMGCLKLNCNLEIPRTVEEIGNSVFLNCPGMKNRKLTFLGDNITTIGEKAFYCTIDHPALIGNLEVPSSVVNIGKSAFYHADFDNIVLTNLSDDVVYGENALSTLKDGSTIYVKNDNQNKKVQKIISENSHNDIAITNGGTFKNGTSFENGKLAIPKKDNGIFEKWVKRENLPNTEVARYVYDAKWLELKDVNLKYGNEEGNYSEDIANKSYGSIKMNLGKGITAKLSEKSPKDIIEVKNTDAGIVINSIGVGENAKVEYYDTEGKLIAWQKFSVIAPDNAVAIVDRKPYSTLKDAIDSISNNTDNVTIDIVKKAGEINNIKIDAPLVINGKNNITINFNGATVSANDSTSTDKKDSLIKINNSTGITIKDANFDLSNGGDVAILVEGTSKVSLEGKITSKKNNSDKAPVISLVGGSAEATLTKGSTINGKLNPDSGLVITDKDSKNNFTNKNNTNTGGGSTPSKPSKPVYTHKEVIGANRYETAAKVADELGSYDKVVLVNATSTMSDGLAASGLAGKENGAILLTKKDSIPKATMDRIKKVKKVYIIGGENAISQKVANQITAANIKVERIGGKNRVETSELVAEKLGNYSNAFIVNGFKGEADAMSASAIAARYEAPILLTNGKTSTHAKKSGVEYYVVGGTSVVNKSIADKYNAERLAGKDRYATNREVIDEFYSGSDKLYLANGETLVDALTASTIAKNYGIVLVNKKSDNSVLKDKNTVQIGGMNFDIDFE